ncbi:MAG TPA: 30S ribosomal protein S6 [Acidimicrobiales bacterium]|nr:30S ribosomal protein S6 [Acidimicrobiales bacterium]
MRPYEVMIILEGSLDESAVQSLINRSTELLESRDGVVNRVDKWGTRRFAYEIDKKQEGIYVLLEITAGNEAVEPFDNFLRLADETVRHKIVRVPEHAAGRTRPTVSDEALEAAVGGRDE